VSLRLPPLRERREDVLPLSEAFIGEIGRAFGGKDHTTVLHAVEKIRTLLQQDPKFKRTLDALTQAING
jgi:chromosomal replication initiator protein